MTEGCRGEGGILVNKDGYRYLQDYGLYSEPRWASRKTNTWNSKPRDRLSQAFYHEWKAGRTVSTPRGDVVYLDLRHLGEAFINERLPFIRSLAQKFAGVDPVSEPDPSAPDRALHHGRHRNRRPLPNPPTRPVCRRRMRFGGLARCQPLGFQLFGRIVRIRQSGGRRRAQTCRTAADGLSHEAFAELAQQAYQPFEALKNRTDGTEKPADIRRELGAMMEAEVGIYRSAETAHAPKPLFAS